MCVCLVYPEQRWATAMKQIRSRVVANDEWLRMIHSHVCHHRHGLFQRVKECNMPAATIPHIRVSSHYRCHPLQLIISVDEMGTKAAAASSVKMTMGSSGGRKPPPAPAPFIFTFDRPFVFSLSRGGNLPIFLGIVEEPTSIAQQQTLLPAPAAHHANSAHGSGNTGEASIATSNRALDSPLPPYLDAGIQRLASPQSSLEPQLPSLVTKAPSLHKTKPLAKMPPPLKAKIKSPSAKPSSKP